jgi:hypothetical protein
VGPQRSERLAELVSAAAYGTVLVLGALATVGIWEIEVGYGLELVGGVGLATWTAHLFAELLGGHIRDPEPLRGGEVRRALADGSPILAATVLPASALALGKLDVLRQRQRPGPGDRRGSGADDRPRPGGRPRRARPGPGPGGSSPSPPPASAWASWP